jgi:nucleoside diphosphate kinase
VTITPETEQDLAASVGKELARDQFYQIIEFMTGYRPDSCPPELVDKPGKVTSMVLIYEGKDAVNKIREVLGPTDPTKAPGGTIRREFGQNVMVNTAHASDSAENALREMEVVEISRNNCLNSIREHLEKDLI